MTPERRREGRRIRKNRRIWGRLGRSILGTGAALRKFGRAVARVAEQTEGASK